MPSNMVTSLLLGFSLALDCFAIALSQGLRAPAPRQLALLALFFGVFQTGMLLLGYGAIQIMAPLLTPFIDWVAAILLIAVGGKMLLEGLREEPAEALSLSRLSAYLILAFATSMDALAAGLSLSALRLPLLLTACFVGLFSSGLTLLGGFFGRHMGSYLGERAELLGGLVLIGLGVQVLL
ncbi:MAG: manganese efflux pump MntP family protein [Candidatus Sericytochromatia bacterium]